MENYEVRKEYESRLFWNINGTNENFSGKGLRYQTDDMRRTGFAGDRELSKTQKSAECYEAGADAEKYFGKDVNLYRRRNDACRKSGIF